MILGTLIALPFLVAHIRPDYFVQPTPPRETWLGRHGVLRTLLLVVKNALGLVLILAGTAMLVLPGQGLLTILFGLTLLNFPGKRRLELWLVRQRGVLRAMNWMRYKLNKPPLVVHENPRGDEG